MKKILFFIFLSLFIFTNNLFAEESKNTGFLKGQIWYSNNKLIEGETVNIYTAVWNSSKTQLSAKVEFYDKNVILGSRDIIVLPQELKDVSISWKITSGDHLISAKILGATTVLDGKKQNIILDNFITDTNKIFVPIVIKTITGEQASSSDLFKNEIEKVGSGISNIIPISVSEPIVDNLNQVNGFREYNLNKINIIKNETKDKIEEFKEIEKLKIKQELNIDVPLTENINDFNLLKESNKEVKISIPVQDATEKPIAYLKYFFFSILSFIFSSSVVFYFVISLIIFWIIRSLYFKFRY